MHHNLHPLTLYSSRIIKRISDLLLAMLVLSVSPFWFLPIALLVKLSSPGPVLFKQLRTGRNGAPFYCYKFRTMVVNAQCDSLQAQANDQRITTIGKFLRNSSLDELPQVVNVLRGNMSMIGPRPHMLKHTEQYALIVENYMDRHEAKPGLTGWAQIHGFRGETKEDWQMQKRVEYDLWYLQNWSMKLDFKILFYTLRLVLRNHYKSINSL